MGAVRDQLSQKNLRLRLAAIGLASYAAILGINALSIWGIFGSTIAVVEVVFMMVPLAAFAALIGALPLILSRSMRSDAISIVIVAAALFAPAIPTFRIADALRMQGFRLAATRAEPVIVAIEKYADAKGTPPDTLQQLVPGFIPAIPTRLPPIQVVSAPDTPRLYEGNAWILSASVVRGFVSFDLFLYFPNQRYPESGYGGSLERIGKWAYVHE